MHFVRTNIKTTIWKFYIFCFLRNLMFLSGVMIPFFTQWGGISLAQTQILQSWFMFWVFVLEIPTGAVADFFGRKYSVALGALVTAIASLVYASKPEFMIFLLAEFLFALGVALLEGADDALLYDALKEAGREGEAKKIYGRVHSIKLSAMLISGPIGGFIASRWGLNYPLIFGAVPMALASIIALTIKEPSLYQAIPERKRYINIVKEGLKYVYRHKKLRRIAIDAVIVASAAYFVIWLYQPVLQNIGLAIIYFGFFHAFLSLTEILVANNFVFLERIAGSGKKLLKVTAILTSIGFLIVSIMPNIVTVIIFIILSGGFGLTRMELMKAYMNKFIPSEKRATVLSAISMLRRFGLIFLNPIIGFAADASVSLALFIVGLLPLTLFLFSPIEQDTLEE